MDKIIVTGNGKLNGVIPISGAKNAALPLMIASLLTTDALMLENVPHLADAESLIRILTNHGVDYQVEGKKKGQNGGHGRTIHFRAGEIVDTTAPYELVSRMRAVLLGYRAAACPHARGARVAAGRLRHRNAPGRPVPRKPFSAWRRHSMSRRATSLPQPRAASRARATASPRFRSAPPMSP